MKRVLNAGIHLNTLHFWLLLFRIAVGLLMISHGWPKLQMLIAGGDIQFMNFLGIGQKASFGLTVFAEFFCSVLIILGLATRMAAIPLIITMCVGIFMAHANDPLGKKELAILYLLIFMTLLVTGPGKFSIDGMVGNKRRR